MIFYSCFNASTGVLIAAHNQNNSITGKEKCHHCKSMRSENFSWFRLCKVVGYRSRNGESYKHSETLQCFKLMHFGIGLTRGILL